MKNWLTETLKDWGDSICGECRAPFDWVVNKYTECKALYYWAVNRFRNIKGVLTTTLRQVIWFVAIIVGVSFAFVFIYLRIYETSQIDTNAPSIFVAVFTLFLAIATIFLALTTHASNKQYRKREARDRKERRLIALIEWANDITKCETAAPLPPLPIAEIAKNASKLGRAKIDAIIEYRNINTNTNLMMRYQNLEAIGERMVLISNILDKEFNCSLGDSTQKTFKKLQTHVKLGPKWIDKKITDEEYKKHWKSLMKSSIDLIKKAEQSIN